MTDTPIPKFVDLEIEDRLLVLGWMRDAIHEGMKKTITAKTYIAFVHALNKGSEFDPAAVWETVQEQSRAHFEHAADILAQLESDIEFIEDSIERTEDAVEDDPFLDVPEENDQVDDKDQAEEEPQ